MFEEEKHPRDSEGKFTVKEYSAMTTDELKKIAVKEYRQDTPYEELTKPQRSSKIDLSIREWAVFYIKLGEIKRGGYVEATANGEKLIAIGNKLVITSGTYEKPKVSRVYVFPSEEILFDTLNKLRR